MANCKNKNCGCNDTALTTPAPCSCNVVTCPTPDICSETWSDCCVIHTGDTIADIGINKGERLCDILQKLTLMITNPDCVIPGAECGSAIGFKSTTITSTALGLFWGAVTGATGYVVEYRVPTTPTWTTLPSVTVNTATISSLLPNTDYYVRVKTVCESVSTCYSVTLLLTTKPA